MNQGFNLTIYCAVILSFLGANLSPVTAESETSPTTESVSVIDNCPSEPDSQRFTIQKIEVVGNTIFQKEIQELIKPWENNNITFEELICLRTAITELYVQNGYITSGAFLPNHQELTSGVAQIQVVEGEIESLEINGLKRL